MRQGGRHEHACPAIVGSGPVYPPHLSCGAVRSAARAAVAPLGIFHAEWRIDRASAAVDAGAAVHRCAGSLAVSARGRQHTRPPAYRAGLSLVERRHPDAGGSAVDDHRTPLLAEHQADRLHRVHVRLVPGPGALPRARGPALAGTQSHDARPGRHRPLATPDLLVAGSACRRRSSHAMRRSPNRTSFLRPLPLTRGGLFLFRFLFARGRLSKSGRVALPLKERSGLTVMPPPIRSRTCATRAVRVPLGTPTVCPPVRAHAPWRTPDQLEKVDRRSIQSGVGASTPSMTTTSTGARTDSSLSPSCSLSAVISDEPSDCGIFAAAAG